jgi:hypothetical protein
MNRKEYEAPAIAWEDVLEQTSLACQATQPFPEGNGGPGAAQIPFAPDILLDCTFSVAKGGAFGPSCNVDLIRQELDPVVLS